MTRPIQTTPSLSLTVQFSTSRKKGTAGIRHWLLIDSSGQARIMEAGKHAIMHRTGLPARDLRILDPLLSYPSTVLGRERAIVVNLEHIKSVITANEVLLLNFRDPSVNPFVEELQRRLTFHYHATKPQEGNGDNSKESAYYVKEPESSSLSFDKPLQGISHRQDHSKGGKVEGKQGIENRDKSKVLPFEFVALEVCLESACNCLDIEAKTLDQEAYPILDKLTSKISTLNLERVRQIKSRLVAITGRVQKVRDELEHLLDDDEDMAEMYLTEKLVRRHFEDSPTSSSKKRDGMDGDGFQVELDDSIPAEASLGYHGSSTSYKNDTHNNKNRQDHLFSTSDIITEYSCESHTSTTKTKQLDVELEMLLEAYFVQIDGTVNKLFTLKEYVDDTEDYINIMLDYKQNNLLKMGAMLTTANLVLTCFIVLVGILGMNIRIELFKTDVQTGMPRFLWTVAGGTAGCIFMYAGALAWWKQKGWFDN